MNRARTSLAITCVAVALTAHVATAHTAHAQIDRGPYLQQGTPNSMIVAYRTAGAEEGSVCWGTSPSSLTTRATGPSGRQHEVLITGLTPDTRYYYAAGSATCPPAGGGDPGHSFGTAPLPGTPRPFRMWVVGDSGTGAARQLEVRDAMLGAIGTTFPDLFLHVGDMAYDSGTTSEFDDNFFAPYAGVLARSVCWPAMGNHEGGSSDSGSQMGPYYDAYVLPTDGEAGGLASGTEAYYSFDWANVHFVVLDSHDSPREPAGAMLRWLDMDLAATDQEWIVLYFHHPPYTKGTHDSDTEGQLVDMRENALPIAEAAGVDLVLAGHSHIYERSYLINGAYDTPTTAAGHVVDMGDGQLDGDGPYVRAGLGTLYAVCGHGGAGVGGSADHPVMFFSETEHGSCLVDVSGPQMTLRNIRYDGAETDHVTLVKGDGIVLVSPRAGETFLAGSTVDIVWTSIGPVGNIRIETSLDGGTTWSPLVDGTPNDGMEPWATPLVSTTRARVRLTDVDDATHVTESGDFTLSGRADVVVVPMGGIWEYQDQGVDQGTEFRTTTGGWASGPAQLGYGDGDEATELLDEDPNIPTVYFRSTFNVDDPVVAARLHVLYDDGIVVWINGQEVANVNVTDPDDFAAYTAADSTDNETADFDIPGDPFVVGENIIAVIVKQSSEGSSDLSFDLELTATVDLGLPSTVDGGVSATDGGPRPDGAGTDAGPGGGDDDGGCGCSVPRSTSSRIGVIAVVCVVLLAAHRRRRPR